MLNERCFRSHVSIVKRIALNICMLDYTNDGCIINVRPLDIPCVCSYSYFRCVWSDATIRVTVPFSLSAQIPHLAIIRSASRPFVRFITFRCSAPAFESYMACLVRARWQRRDTKPARKHSLMRRHLLVAGALWLRASAPRTRSFILVQSARKRHQDGIQIMVNAEWPNKSPEPTAVGAVRSAVAVHVASRRWLSFLR